MTTQTIPQLQVQVLAKTTPPVVTMPQLQVQVLVSAAAFTPPPPTPRRPFFLMSPLRAPPPAPAPAGGGDPHWPDVAFYLGTQGTPGTNAFQDLSANNLPVLVTGGAVFDNAQSLVPGGTSIRMPGTVTDSTNYLRVAATAALNLPGDFTLEGWFWFVSAKDAFTKAFQKGTTTTVVAAERRSDDGTTGVPIPSLGSYYFGNPIALGGWHHMALDRQGTVLRFYVDGDPAVVAASLSENPNNSLYIGIGSPGDNADMDGYVGAMRVTRYARFVGVPFVPTIDAAGWMQESPVAYALGLPHRYWRVRYLNTWGSPNSSLADLYMAETTGGATICTGGAPLGTVTFAGEGVANAFDNNGATVATPLGKTGAFGYALAAGTQQVVNEVRIRARTGFLDTQPAGFVVQSSNDGVRWLTEWTVTGLAAWTAGETRSFARP